MVLLLLAAFFLPLFPFSAVLGVIIARLPHPAARAAVLLAWPQIGVYLLHTAAIVVPEWLVAWAIATSVLYAFRMLTARDLPVWTTFLATSSYALIWALAAADAPLALLLQFALGFSLPAALLVLLAGSLARRLGAAYGGLHGGLGSVLPRLSTLLVLTVLAAVATPPFPAFFTLLGMLLKLAPWALGSVLLIWLIWAWGATSILQSFVYGPKRAHAVSDIAQKSALLYGTAILVLALAGIYFSGSAA